MRGTSKKVKIQVSKNDERLKKLVQSQIPLSNDVFMIFAKSKKFCQEFLRVILQDKKLVVLENDIQKHLPSAFSKSMVLDMLCRLGDSSIVNIEIQLTNEKGHAGILRATTAETTSFLCKRHYSATERCRVTGCGGHALSATHQTEERRSALL